MTTAQLTGVSLAFGDRDVLQDVTLTLTDSRRVALTGANGSGKTTLLRIVHGEVDPDRGSVHIPPGVRIGHLPQSGLPLGERTLYEEAESAYDRIRALVAERERVGEELQQRTNDSRQEETAHLLERFHDLEERIEESGYHEREADIHYVLTGLGFTREDFATPATSFSGGWQMRIALARILLERPHQLLLDEPTNYLDIEARTWLLDFLRQYRGGYVVVSHDRYFLDQTTTEVAELFTGSLSVYTGNFTEYERVRHKELEQLEKRYWEQQEEIARLEDFIRRFRSNASRASLVQSRIKQLEKMERIELPETMKPIRFSFPPAPSSGRRVVRAHGIARSYGTMTLFREIDFEIERGEKIVVVGRNGAGKSTLLRILAGVDDDYRGDLEYGTGVRVASFSQDDVLPEDGSRTVLEEAEQAAPTEAYPKLRNLLGAFLFRGDDVFKSTGVLSGGERSRLSLLKMLLEPANLLVLDEPTNHLDMSSKQVLLDALKSFSGTVVFVSHDRYFITELATRVFELARPDSVSPAALRSFPGDYEYYLYRTRDEHDASAAGAGAGPAGRTGAAAGRRSDAQGPREQAGRGGHRQGSPGQPGRSGHREGSPVGPSSRAPGRSPDTGAPPTGAKQTYESAKQRRNRLERLEREEAGLVHRLEELERRHGAVQEEMARPEAYSDGDRMRQLRESLEECEAEHARVLGRWEELESERLELDREKGS